jgi:hypothetical protein
MIASPAGLWCRVSPPWLLRALLLLKVDVDPQLLREKYLENESFAFYRENTEPRVRVGISPQSRNPSNANGRRARQLIVGC